MTVAQLIEELQDMVRMGTAEDDTEVMFTYNYGDHGRTTVAGEIKAVTEETVTYSDYFNMHRIASDRDESDDDREQRIPSDDEKKIVALGSTSW